MAPNDSAAYRNARRLGLARGLDGNDASDRGAALGPSGELIQGGPEELLETIEPGAMDVADLYDRHGPELFRYSYRLLRDRARAEEAVQDTFVRAWRRYHLWDPRIGSHRTWLFSIAHNVCIDAIRASQARPVSSGAAVHDPPVTSEPTLEAAMDGWLMEEALRRVREEQRVAIVETYLRGRSYGEVAKATGVNEATLRSRVFYGLKALRVAMEELGWMP